MSVENGLIVTFPDGMVGFPTWRSFKVVADPDGGPVKMLESVDELDVSLFVADPSSFYPDFAVVLTPDEIQALDLSDPAEAEYLSILTVTREPTTITANLLGPIVLNPRNGLARQIVLSDSGYPSRYPVVGDAPADEAEPPSALSGPN